MKSVLQAAWLLTVSFGNLLDVVIVEMEVSDKQSHEFFFFAALMFLGPTFPLEASAARV